MLGFQSSHRNTLMTWKCHVEHLWLSSSASHHDCLRSELSPHRFQPEDLPRRCWCWLVPSAMAKAAAKAGGKCHCRSYPPTGANWCELEQNMVESEWLKYVEMTNQFYKQTSTKTDFTVKMVLWCLTIQVFHSAPFLTHILIDQSPRQACWEIKHGSKIWFVTSHSDSLRFWGWNLSLSYTSPSMLLHLAIKKTGAGPDGAEMNGRSLLSRSISTAMKGIASFPHGSGVT